MDSRGKKRNTVGTKTGQDGHKLKRVGRRCLGGGRKKLCAPQKKHTLFRKQKGKSHQ